MVAKDGPQEGVLASATALGADGALSRLSVAGYWKVCTM